MTKNYTLPYIFLFLVAFMPSSIQAQCTFGNDVGSFDPQNNFDWAQSFTAECDGFLEYVEFITGSGGTQQARTLEIFEGATVSGEPIYTQEFPVMNFGAAGESLRINLAEEFPITSGDIFTFQIPGVTVNLLVDINNPYPGGFAFENGGEFGQVVDFVFNVSITDEFLALDDLDLMIISAYPNPTSEIIDVSLGSFQQEITIRTYNFIGELVMEERITNTNLLRMDIAPLAMGTYYSIVMTPSNRGIFRFIKS
ncbi:T9SS type A sorting domain-containing protein [uncultured Dokdonia sp.]|uniref:T9SS type A sorting domain-containing protein n=1 Tax=uncultured Dokdonia sp. TaxID=575653 RepID=UPI00260F4CD3|nr:T9SS type A sorting domain-containing protein [uncultured Dokdonia sp.]